MAKLDLIAYADTGDYSSETFTFEIGGLIYNAEDWVAANASGREWYDGTGAYGPPTLTDDEHEADEPEPDEVADRMIDAFRRHYNTLWHDSNVSETLAKIQADALRLTREEFA